MLQLSRDETFHYELLRLLGTARDLGADVAEVLNVADRIIPGNFESWYTEFHALARRVQSQATQYTAQGAAHSARNAHFRAAGYFRAADFFLHGNPADGRILSIWKEATRSFDSAIGALPVPGQRFRIQADGFEIPAVFYRASARRRACPTLLMCNGYDGSQEEMFHVCGLAACARGFNVVTFEGPGQPSVIRDQGLTFIDAWEEVVTPLIDWCETQPEIDGACIGLMGYSFGGWLVARAAAREHRVAAVACVDGILDAGAAFMGVLSPPLQQLFRERRAVELNAAVRSIMIEHTNVRWAVEHGCWVYGCSSPFDFLARAQTLTLTGITRDITCPVLVCDADTDAFFKGQPQALVNALGDRATHRVFKEEDSASAHCHVGASDLMNGTVMDWFRTTLALPDAIVGTGVLCARSPAADRRNRQVSPWGHPG
jgi:pimeloyl-ACP methyl ester carboxylesterase